GGGVGGGERGGHGARGRRGGGGRAGLRESPRAGPLPRAGGDGRRLRRGLHRPAAALRSRPERRAAGAHGVDAHRRPRCPLRGRTGQDLMSTVRLLQFVSVFAIGGTERHVVDLAPGLDRTPLDPQLACLKRWGDFLADVEATRTPLAEYRIGSLYRGRTLRQQLRFVQDLRAKAVDVVHAYGFHANVFAVPAARLAGARAVVASIRD